MGILFAGGVAQKIREQIAAWRIAPALVAREIFGALEAIDENPAIGSSDTEGVFHGALYYQFLIEIPPVVLNISIAYKVERRADGHDVRILDFAPRRIRD